MRCIDKVLCIFFVGTESTKISQTDGGARKVKPGEWSGLVGKEKANK